MFSTVKAVLHIKEKRIEQKIQFAKNLELAMKFNDRNVHSY